MAMYLQAMCAECKRLFAFSVGRDRVNTVVCSHCGSSSYSAPTQINVIEYREVINLYKP